MEQNGLLEAQEQIVSHILLMEPHGLPLLLELLSLQVNATQSHGVEHDGLLEEMEQINSRILLMVKRGMHLLLEMVYLHNTASQ
jgi:hypothetical protein